MSKELVVAKEELMDAKLKMNRAEKITEQVKNELMDVTVKACNAEQSLEKKKDDLSCTKEELVIAKTKISKAEQNLENIQKEVQTRMLKLQEEFYQWKELSSLANCGALRSLGDWKTRLMLSSMLLEQSNIVAPCSYHQDNRCLGEG